MQLVWSNIRVVMLKCKIVKPSLWTVHARKFCGLVLQAVLHVASHLAYFLPDSQRSECLFLQSVDFRKDDAKLSRHNMHSTASQNSQGWLSVCQCFLSWIFPVGVEFSPFSPLMMVFVTVKVNYNPRIWILILWPLDGYYKGERPSLVVSRRTQCYISASPSYAKVKGLRRLFCRLWGFFGFLL